jgi:hypothetical protein
MMTSLSVAVSNSSGVMYPRALCSRVPLYQAMYSTVAPRAAVLVGQGCWSRHSPFRDAKNEWLARQLRLEVAEVRVQALDRQGSKVQIVADALEMLDEVWTIRRARTNRADGNVGSAPIASLEAAASPADPPPGAMTTPAGAPPALQAG